MPFIFHMNGVFLFLRVEFEVLIDVLLEQASQL